MSKKKKKVAEAVASSPAPPAQPPVEEPRRRRKRKAAEAQPATAPAAATSARGCRTEFCVAWRQTFANIARSCAAEVRAKYPPGQRLRPYIECLSVNARKASQELRARYGLPPPKPRKRKKSPIPLEEHVKMMGEAAKACSGRPRNEYYMCLAETLKKLREEYLAKHGAIATPAPQQPAPPVPAPPPPVPAPPAGEVIPAVEVTPVSTEALGQVKRSRRRKKAVEA